MSLSIFLQGLFLGLAYVMPIGSQNIYVVQCSMNFGFPASLLVAFIVSFIDISLGIACFYGIGTLVSSNIFFSAILLIGGGTFLIYLGYSLLVSSVQKLNFSKAIQCSVAKILSSAISLTWFNPQAIIDGSIFLGAYSQTIKKSDYLFFLLGMSTASVSWFFSISILISCLRKKISTSVFLVINKICGILLIAFAFRLFFLFAKEATKLF